MRHWNGFLFYSRISSVIVSFISIFTPGFVMSVFGEEGLMFDSLRRIYKGFRWSGTAPVTQKTGARQFSGLDTS